MSNLLDVHSSELKNHIALIGRPVVLTDKDDNKYGEDGTLYAIWNDVEHGLKIDGFEADPIGEKSSIYFDTETLFNLGIDPTKGWKVTGSPTKFEEDKDYYLEIPKIDRQLPGKLYFISQDRGIDAGWNKGGIL